MEKVGVTDSESQENDSSPHEETRRDFLMISTVSVGAIGAGLAACNNGAIAGRETTGPELNRIEDALGLI